jgi:hypothetical protein
MAAQSNPEGEESGPGTTKSGGKSGEADKSEKPGKVSQETQSPSTGKTSDSNAPSEQSSSDSENSEGPPGEKQGTTGNSKGSQKISRSASPSHAEDSNAGKADGKTGKTSKSEQVSASPSNGQAEPTESQGSQSIEGIEKLIDEARRRLQEGSIPDDAMDELGMTEPELTQFIKKYQTEIDMYRQNRNRMQARISRDIDQVEGSEVIQHGTGTSEAVRDVSGQIALEPDQIEKLRESLKTEVSPEYRKQVERYLRAMSENEPANPQHSQE